MARVKLFVVVAFATLTLLAVGCHSRHSSGREKRRLLISNIEAVNREQAKAATQFQDALARLNELSGYEGGDLKKVSRKLESGYEDCDARVADVRSHIRDMERMAGAMFMEWEKEVMLTPDAEVRSRSTRTLEEIRRRYHHMDDTMTQCAFQTGPVLRQLKDYAFYLKNSLNSPAMDAIQAKASTIRAQVEQVLANLQTSIGEAQEFVQALDEAG
jgi:hypothetical protein